MHHQVAELYGHKWTQRALHALAAGDADEQQPDDEFDAITAAAAAGGADPSAVVKPAARDAPLRVRLRVGGRELAWEGQGLEMLEVTGPHNLEVGPAVVA